MKGLRGRALSGAQEDCPRPRLGRRVVRGIVTLLSARDGNLLVAAATSLPAARRDYQHAVGYLERLVAWAGKRSGG